MLVICQQEAIGSIQCKNRKWEAIKLRKETKIQKEGTAQLEREGRVKKRKRECENCWTKTKNKNRN